jgi:hypothetical protein
MLSSHDALAITSTIAIPDIFRALENVDIGEFTLSEINGAALPDRNLATYAASFRQKLELHGAALQTSAFPRGPLHWRSLQTWFDHCQHGALFGP